MRTHERTPGSLESIDEQAAAAILGAVEHVARRSEGPEAWVASPATDPIAFLLFSISDPVNIWSRGSIIFRNRAAEALGLARSEYASDERVEAANRIWERRCLRFQRGDTEYLLEILTEAHGPV